MTGFESIHRKLPEIERQLTEWGDANTEAYGAKPGKRLGRPARLRMPRGTRRSVNQRDKNATH